MRKIICDICGEVIIESYTPERGVVTFTKPPNTLIEIRITGITYKITDPIDICKKCWINGFKNIYLD